MSSRPELRLDWCTHEAAKYAVENWHYSKSLPPPPHNLVGAWENGKYIGAVIFSRGANNNMLAPYGLKIIEGCELTRVALREHKTPVSRIIAIAIKFLKSRSPMLRLIVSYADPNVGHHGGIYQAGGWVYCGKSSSDVQYLAPDGKKWQSRMISERGWQKVYGEKRPVWKKSQCVAIKLEGKHRYLMPLDDEIRQCIEPLRKPYPKRVRSEDSGTAGNQSAGGGANPTRTLHNSSA